MSSSRALCCLPSVKRQKHDFNFFFVHCIIKQLFGFGFGDIQNNQSFGKGYQPQPSASADDTYLDLVNHSYAYRQNWATKWLIL